MASYRLHIIPRGSIPDLELSRLKAKFSGPAEGKEAVKVLDALLHGERLTLQDGNDCDVEEGWYRVVASRGPTAATAETKNYYLTAEQFRP